MKLVNPNLRKLTKNSAKHLRMSGWKKNMKVKSQKNVFKKTSSSSSHHKIDIYLPKKMLIIKQAKI